MKRIIVLALAIMLAPVVSHAELPAPKIAVVDVQKIMRDAKAAKALASQLDAKRKEYQGQIDAVEKKLKAQEVELIKQKATLTKEALAAKAKEFEAQVTSARKDVQAKKTKLEKSYRTALGTIQTNIQGIIEQLATEQGFNIALPTSQLIYATANLDVSAEVLKRLDAKLPTVAMKF